MSATQSTKAAAAQTVTQEQSLLDELASLTRQTDRSRTEELLGALTTEALKGTITWDQNVNQTIKAGIKALDQVLSKQLAAIMHHPDLQKLEGSWRGLHHLVMNSETS